MPPPLAPEEDEPLSSLDAALELEEEEIRALPPPPQVLRRQLDEPLQPLPKIGEARYSSQADPEQCAQWFETFRQFDRDGGGDVDLRELGLMLRGLGQTPSEEEMKLLIEEVDIDQSGTIDVEEFCLLMMRQLRLAECPDWLFHMLHPPLFGGALEPDEPPLASVATLNDGKYDAAQRIRRHVGLSSGEINRVTSAVEHGKTSARPKELENVRFNRELLLTIVDLLPSAEHIRVAQLCGHAAAFGPFVAQELLWRLATSSFSRLEHLNLGFDALGDDGAVAVAMAIGKLPHLVTIDLSGNGIAMRGASALYEAMCRLPKSSKLQAIRLDDNPDISSQMQSAISMQALANNLKAIVDLARVQPLPLDAAKPELADADYEGGAGSHPLEVQAEGMALSSWPRVDVEEVWLSQLHMPALRTLLSASSASHPPIKSLQLRNCPRVTDGAIAHLLSASRGGAGGGAGAAAAMARGEAAAAAAAGGGGDDAEAMPPADRPPPSHPPSEHTFLRSLEWLRISSCHLGDASIAALCVSMEGGHLNHLLGLAADRNRFTLSMGGTRREESPVLGGPRRGSKFGLEIGGFNKRVSAPPKMVGGGGGSGGDSKESSFKQAQAVSYPLATRFGRALRGLPKLEELDLCHNEQLDDDAAAFLTRSLLEPPAATQPSTAADGQQGGSVVRRTSRPPPISFGGENGAASRVAAADAAAIAAARQAAPSLRILHLGATGAGNRSAAALASVLPSSRLRSACLGKDVGDVGMAALAIAVPRAPTLRELWLGNKIGDMGLEQLGKVLSHPSNPIKLLGLGGKVRGDVQVSNRLEARAPSMLAHALRQQPEGLTELRLSGNSRMGGEGVVALLRSLVSCQSLRELHVDGCGLTHEHGKALAEAINEVWCLHVLVLETAVLGQKMADKRKGGAHGVWSRKRDEKPAVLKMAQRLHIARTLEDNKTMGRRRVDTWRLSRSLDEVAWVFSTLCAGFGKEELGQRLSSWDGKMCGRFVENLGLPQYSQSFEFNLTGAQLPTLAMGHLAQMGVTAYEDQKQIMKSVRSLIHAYERRDAVAKAQNSWMMILSQRSQKALKHGGAGAPAEAKADGEMGAAEQPMAAYPRPPRRRGGGRVKGGGARRGRTSAPAADDHLGGGGGGSARDDALLGLETTSQRPDPSAAALRLPMVGSSLSARARLEHVHRIQAANAAMAPAAGAAVTLPPLAASQADAGMMGGRGALPMAGPPAAALPSSTWMGAPPAPPSHFHDLAPPPSQERVGTRDGTGVLPVAPWLYQSPRGGKKRAPKRGDELIPHPPGVGSRAARALRRDDDLSRRILASLADGGKMPAPPEKLAPFVAPTKHEYTHDPFGRVAPPTGSVS